MEVDLIEYAFEISDVRGDYLCDCAGLLLRLLFFAVTRDSDLTYAR